VFTRKISQYYYRNSCQDLTTYFLVHYKLRHFLGKYYIKYLGWESKTLKQDGRGGYLIIRMIRKSELPCLSDCLFPSSEKVLDRFLFQSSLSILNNIKLEPFHPLQWPPPVKWVTSPPAVDSRRILVLYYTCVILYLQAVRFSRLSRPRLAFHAYHRVSYF